MGVRATAVPSYDGLAPVQLERQRRAEDEPLAGDAVAESAQDPGQSRARSSG